MWTRRGVLQGCVGIAGALAFSLNLSALRRDPSVRRNIGTTRAVFDRDFPEALLFGRAARDLGISTHAISGDVTSVWYDDLYFHWQRGSAVVAGLTGSSALFCLERLAWDSGYRVFLRVDHERSSDGTVKHEFHGPCELLPAIAQLLQRSDWGEPMAELLARCPVATASCTSSALPRTPSRSPSWSEPLVSWIIAPRSTSPRSALT